MGLIFNGNGDVIKAVDGSLTVEGLDFGGISNVNAGIGTFSGNLNVGGVLTYEDVKNVDSVGVVTAREGIFLPDTKELKLGNSAASPDLKLYSTGTNGWVYTPQSGADLYMGTNAGEVYIQTGSSGNDTAIKVNSGGAVELYYNGAKTVETTVNALHLIGNNAESNITCKTSDGTTRGILGVTNSNSVTLYSGSSTKAWEYASNALTLYHTGNAKLATTSTGVTVTGTLTATTLTGALSTTDACQTGDLTILNGNPDLRLKDSNHGGNNTEHMIAFQDSSGNNQMNIGSPFGEQHLRIKHGTNELVKIQTDGKFLVGHTAAYGSGKAQVHNTSQYCLDVATWAADATGPTIDFYKSRNATPGSATIVQNNDVVGRLRFLGNDGANSRTAAQITAEVDGTPGTNDMPGRLVFSTVPDNSTTVTERLRIASTGYVQTKSELWVGGSAPVLRWRDTTHGEKATARISGSDLYFEVANNERLRIKSDGKIGIGNVTSPIDNVEIRTDAHGEGVTIKSTGNTSNALTFDANRSGANNGIGNVYGRWNGTTVAQISFNAGSDTTDKNDGYIWFGTESAASNGNVNATERLRIDNTGALGLGITPKNNGGTYRQLQIGLGAHFYGRTDDTPIYLSSNAYYDGSNWKYTANTTVSQIAMGTNITFKNAPSGTAGNTVSLTERLRITSAGKVGVNESSPDHMFHIKGTSADNNPVLAVESNTWAIGKSAALRLAYTDGNAREIRGHYDHGLQFFLNNGESMRIDTAGHITSPTHCCFEVKLMSSQSFTSGSRFKINFTRVENQQGTSFDTSNNRFTAPVAGYYQFNVGVYSYYSTFMELDGRCNGASTGVKTYRPTTRNDNGADGNPGASIMASWIVKLAKDDYYEIFCQCNSSHGTRYLYADINRTPTWWSGFLIC